MKKYQNGYRIKRRKSWLRNFLEGPEYLSVFDFKKEYDYRPSCGSYFSKFIVVLIINDFTKQLALTYDGEFEPFRYLPDKE